MESRYNRFICVLASIPSLEEVGGLGSEERSEGGAGGGGMKDFGSNRFKSSLLVSHDETLRGHEKSTVARKEEETPYHRESRGILRE